LCRDMNDTGRVLGNAPYTIRLLQIPTDLVADQLVRDQVCDRDRIVNLVKSVR